MANQGTGETKTELTCPLCRYIVSTVRNLISYCPCSGTFLDLVTLETHAGDCDGTQVCCGEDCGTCIQGVPYPWALMSCQSINEDGLLTFFLSIFSLYFFPQSKCSCSYKYSKKYILKFLDLKSCDRRLISKGSGIKESIRSVVIIGKTGHQFMIWIL